MADVAAADATFHQAVLVGLGAIPRGLVASARGQPLRADGAAQALGHVVGQLAAAFALGLVLGLQRSGRCDLSWHFPMILLIGVGFFSSLSTFSTLPEVLNTLRDRRGEALLLAVGSVLGGLPSRSRIWIGSG